MEDSDIQNIIEKNPDLKKSKEALNELKPGAYCLHRSWGLGLIKEYLADEGKLIIDFEGKPNHKMDLVFCVSKLKVVSEKSLLARKQREPKVIEEMINESPCDVIVEIIQQIGKGHAESVEIESTLLELFGDNTYKKWWVKTKKLLVKDPRIQTPIRKSDPYTLREEPVKLEHEILEDFYSLKHLEKKVLLAEKLHKLSDNVEEIVDDLPSIFEHLTNAIRDSKKISRADQLRGIWVRNDLARHLDEDPDLIEPTSKGLILKAEDLNKLSADIPTTQQRRLLDLILRTYPDNWLNVLLELLRNSSGKLISEIVSFLLEKNQSKDVQMTLESLLDEQSLKAPLIYWIIRNRNTRKFKKILENLINFRLFNNLLYAVEGEALKVSSTRKIPLSNLLIEDKDLTSDLLRDASEDQAKDLAQNLLSNQGFEDLLRRSILVRFIRRFPSIEAFISRSAEQKREDLIVSQESLDRIRKEYEELVGVKIPENKKAIEVAREHGDLRENSEYKMARQDQDLLLARKDQLDRDISTAQVTDFKNVGKSLVGIGSIVNLKRKSDSKKEVYAILGAWDSDPENNILSYKTPLAQALLGKKENVLVTTNVGGNEVEWMIQSISRWVDSNRKLS